MEDEEERRRRQAEMDEAERLRRLAEEEEERRRRMAEDAARRKDNAERKRSRVRETFTDQNKKDTDINIKGDPLVHNEGDEDLAPFLNPLIK